MATDTTIINDPLDGFMHNYWTTNKPVSQIVHEEINGENIIDAGEVQFADAEKVQEVPALPPHPNPLAELRDKLKAALARNIRLDGKEYGTDDAAEKAKMAVFLIDTLGNEDSASIKISTLQQVDVYGLENIHCGILGNNRDDFKLTGNELTYTADALAKTAAKLLAEIESNVAQIVTEKVVVAEGQVEQPADETSSATETAEPETTTPQATPFTKPTRQNLSGLPPVIQDSKRFFAVGTSKNPKQPITKDWSNPQNQKTWQSINGAAGFDTSGHNVDVDYLFVDFDHVLDASGNFLYPEGEKVYNELLNISPDIFVEVSLSGTGLHAFLIPTDGKFQPMASGGNGALTLSETPKAQIEFFYKTGGRYCYVTGAPFRHAGNIVPDAKDYPAVDVFFENMLKKIAAQNMQKNEDYAGEPLFERMTPAEMEAEKSHSNTTFTHTDTVFQSTDSNTDNSAADDFNPNDLFDALRVREMLRIIEPAKLNYTDWLKVMTAAKNLQFTYAEVDAFNKRDPARYNADENRTTWEKVTDTGFGVNVLYRLAEKFGYDAKQFTREYHRYVAQDFNEKDYAGASGKHSPTSGESGNSYDDDDDSLDFITDEGARHDFIKLRRQPKSPQRDRAMIQIICNYLDWDFSEKTARHWIKNRARNFRAILGADPNLHKLWGLDEFKSEVVTLAQPPWRPEPFIGKSWHDNDDACLRLYICENYYDLNNRMMIDDYFRFFALKNQFHEVRNWLKNLPRWDGVNRAETFFVDYLQVTDSAYVREATSIFFSGALARIFKPGCEFQNVLVLLGSQGIGKSGILKKLAGQWHDVLSDSVEDPHALDAIARMWIVEVEEFFAGNRASNEALKSFFSRAYDTRRAPFERRAQKIGRHVVFVITTNNRQLLRDATGNRRYMILESNAKFGDNSAILKLTDEVVAQIWAEVYFKFWQKFKTVDDIAVGDLELSAAARREAESVANQFMIDDGTPSDIGAFLDVKIPHALIWAETTKDERREFFKRGYLELDADEAAYRLRDVPAFEKDEVYETATQTAIPAKGGGTALIRWRFRGVRYRMETCAAEIANEYYGSDARRMIYRVNEALAEQVEGWQLKTRKGGKHCRDRKFAQIYGDQKKVYFRVGAPPADESSATIEDDDCVIPTPLD